MCSGGGGKEKRGNREQLALLFCFCKFLFLPLSTLSISKPLFFILTFF